MKTSRTRAVVGIVLAALLVGPQIGAAPQTAPAGPAAAAPAAVQLPADPALLDFFQVDLSKLVNRALGDDEANDGQGGWTDQGPGFDLRGFGTGKKEYEGIPFTILEPLSCVVLHSRQRPQSKLPQSVTIPVGRKADVLCFLHSGAMLAPGMTNWTYRIRYADGKRETIPVIPGVNVRNWENSNNPEFDHPPGLHTAPAPDRVGNTLSPMCGVYVTQWLNPRREVAIKEIEMVSAGEGVPILLAITGGVKK